MAKHYRSGQTRAARPFRLKFWHRTYLATLALFFACLVAVFGVSFSIARQQSYRARINELLGQQHYIVQSLVQDSIALTARNPAALNALYAYYGQQYRSEDLYIEIYQDGEQAYSSLPGQMQVEGSRPELAVGAGQRTYLVQRTSAGRRLFAATRLSGTLSGTVVVYSADMEAFYLQWESTALLFVAAGGAISAIFALALYLVLRRLYQPLAQVTAMANRLAAGDRAARASVQRRDEFGELAVSLNSMADTVAAQMDELQTLADQRQRLIENLSHEIRTPLAAISGWAETLRGATLSEAEQADAVDTILFESNRILSLSKQMLALSVLRHDETLPMRPVETAPLLARVQAVLAPKAGALQVAWQAEQTPAFDAVQGDAALLESLLINLCDNAIKACMPGGHASLTTALLPDGGRQFLVRDDGRGMRAETLRNLGQPFYREDKSRSRRECGAGLGVALCMEIARQHGAALTYESTPGQGTLARLTLPAFTTSTQSADSSVKAAR